MRSERALVAFACVLAMGFGAAGDPGVSFVPHLIDMGLSGGYQVVVADLNRDGRPDIIALASGLREVRWYENPGWAKHVLVTGINEPINAAVFDSDGDGIPEIALAHEFSNVYSKSLGIVSLLRHQGDPRVPWSMTEIDRVPTSHRLRFVDVEGTGRKVLVNFPLVGPEARAPDYQGHVSLLMYRPGDWKREVITGEDAGVVHGIAVTAWNGGRRESLLSGSFRGIYRLEVQAGRWTRSFIASGDPDQCPKCGTSDVIAGRIGAERFVAAIEPWHGNEVVVYRARGGSSGPTWQRHVIDESLVDAHTIVAGDFDGDGRDELVVGERQGRQSTYIYRPTNAKEDAWERQVLDDRGMAAAGCAVEDIDVDRRPDVVCIGTATANLKWYENKR